MEPLQKKPRLQVLSRFCIVHSSSEIRGFNAHMLGLAAVLPFVSQKQQSNMVGWRRIQWINGVMVGRLRTLGRQVRAVDWVADSVSGTSSHMRQDHG